jgi:hypothetical protein
VSHAKFIEIDGKRVLWRDMLEKRREQLALVAAKRLVPSRRAPTSMEAISEGQLADSSISAYRPRRSRIFPARPKLLVCAAFVLRHASTSDRTPQPTSGQVADRNGHAALTIGRSIVPR